MRKDKIAHDALPVVVHHPQVVLRLGIPLRCRPVVPTGRFNRIPGNALGLAVHLPQIELRCGIAVLGQCPECTECCRVFPALVCGHTLFQRPGADCGMAR